MSIVLNEYEWAERMIAEHSLGNKPTETLVRVAKYYYENKYPKREIRGMLDDFMLQCDSRTELSKWSGTLDRIVKNVNKFPLAKIDGVEITEPELKTIEVLNGKQLKRLAFTLLCIAKYWDIVSPNNDHWVNNTDKEIMQMANIGTSIKRQSLMFSTLKEAGLIKFAKKIDNLNVQVIFTHEGERAMYIQDYRNLGYRYLMYCGEDYFECANCGLVTKVQHTSGRPQKYCPSCAVEVKTRQTVNSVMRQRVAARTVYPS